MTSLHSRVALWLLDCCCGGSYRSSLTGDVLEEFTAGRQSPFWLWKQVVVAMVLSIPADVHADRRQAVRALMIGTLVLPAAQFGAAAVTGDALPVARAFTTGFLTAVVLAGAVCRFPFGVVTAFAALYSVITVPWTTLVAVGLPLPDSLGHAAHQGILIVMTVAGLATGVLMSGRPRSTPASPS
jgi:hypothetical protein